jgi:ectoine hydroxylase-related dioxygenase (phytanoyl-CoA dioxygenase family)
VICTETGLTVFGPDELAEFEAFFRANGFGVLRGALPAADFDAFVAAAEAMQAGYETGTLPDEYIAAGAEVRSTVDGTPVAHYLVRVTDYSPDIKALAHHPTIADAVQRAIGPTAWAGDYFGDGFVFVHARPSRDSNYSRLGWHCDWQSQPDSVMFPCVTVTIHIDHTSPGNGFLRLVPGSHLRAVDQVPAGFGKVPGEIAFYAEPGDVLVHSHLVWHSAARGTDDGSGGVRRHIRGGWYAGRRFDPGRDVNVFIKAAQY